MIRVENIKNVHNNLITLEEGREIDPLEDPEMVRLVAVNLELAVKNLIDSKAPLECLTLSANICTHRVTAIPTADGGVKVLVFEN